MDVNAHASVRSDAGLVVWITGLPCAGKTTVGRALWALSREQHWHSTFLDGDMLRQVFGSDLGFSLADRRIAAERNARLAAMLASQGIHTVVATVSMFEEVRRWNRTNIERYFEVYLRVPFALRRARDAGGIYDRRELVGLDLSFEEPERPDLVIDDDGSRSVHSIVEAIWSRVKDAP